MRLPGVRGQNGVRDFTYRADGTSTGSAQLVLPEGTRSYFFIQNISDTTMFVEFGSARGHATLTNGAVTSVTIDNAGFNFTRPPIIQFLGGGQAGGGPGESTNTALISAGNPNFPPPYHPAKGRCVLSGNTVGSVIIDDGGSGYTVAPYVLILNDPLDLNGCADPSAGGGSGLQLLPGSSLYEAHLSVPTDAVALYCASASKKFTCRWM